MKSDRLGMTIKAVGAAAMLLLFGTGADAQGVKLEETAATRPYLRWERPSYQNYAIQNYRNYPNHAVPYEDTPRAIYDAWGTISPRDTSSTAGEKPAAPAWYTAAKSSRIPACRKPEVPG